MDRRPRQAVPHVAELAVDDTIYLGYRDKGQIRLLGRMRIGQPDRSLDQSEVFCAVPAPLVSEFVNNGYTPDPVLGEMVGIWVQDLEPVDGTIRSRGRFTIMPLDCDPLGEAESEPPIAPAGPAELRSLAPSQRPSDNDQYIALGIDVGGRVDKGFDLCFLTYNGTSIDNIEFERCEYPQALPPTDELRQATMEADFRTLADLTYPASVKTATALWGKVSKRQVRGIFIDSPSGFSRNQNGHGRLTEKVSYRGVHFQCTPSVAASREHRGQWNWLVYGMVAFATCLHYGPQFSKAEWEGAFREGLYFRTRHLQRCIVRECFPTVTVSVLRNRQRADQVCQLLCAHSDRQEVKEVLSYLQNGVAAVKCAKPLYDRADALVAALSSLPHALPNQFQESEPLPHKRVRWNGMNGDELLEGRIAVTE